MCGHEGDHSKGFDPPRTVISDALPVRILKAGETALAERGSDAQGSLSMDHSLPPVFTTTRLEVCGRNHLVSGLAGF
jgi:hypothetical protein